MTEELKKLNEAHEQTVNGLVYQLDAHKQMLNENLQISLNLRTNLCMFQKEYQKLQVQVADLTKQLADANAKIVELSKAPIENPPA